METPGHWAHTPLVSFLTRLVDCNVKGHTEVTAWAEFSHRLPDRVLLSAGWVRVPPPPLGKRGCSLHNQAELGGALSAVGLWGHSSITWLGRMFPPPSGWAEVALSTMGLGRGHSLHSAEVLHSPTLYAPGDFCPYRPRAPVSLS